MSSITTIFISLLGGILPAVFWLWFWLKEDRLHPEPKTRIITIFLAGMVSVFIVLPVEKFIFDITLSKISTVTIILWASIEEIFKFITAYLSGLKRREMDEPIDAVIYMITVALGFSALENALFIGNFVNQGFLVQSLLIGNSRFIGATLLHVASSAVVGVFLGLTYYKSHKIKRIAALLGIFVSIVLHSAFNLLIIKLESEKFFIFAGVWVLIISIFLLIEKVKTTYS